MAQQQQQQQQKYPSYNLNCFLDDKLHFSGKKDDCFQRHHFITNVSQSERDILSSNWFIRFTFN
jgi:hypothetical protein